MIYHTLNKFNYDLGRKCLIAEGWCPVSAIEGVTLALRRGRERSGALIPSILQPKTTTETPPTFFHTDYVLPPSILVFPFLLLTMVRSPLVSKTLLRVMVLLDIVKSTQQCSLV